MDSDHLKKDKKANNCCTILVTYNGEQWIQNCLSSLFSSLYPTDVIIIDNGSKDRTLEIVKSFSESIHLVETGENLGFGGANNIGINWALAAGYEYFFLLNQDTWIEPNSIGLLIEELKRNPGFGIMSPVHMNGQMSAFDKNFKKFVRRYKYIDLPFEENNLEKHSSPLVVGFVNAAAWMIPRFCFEKVGVFNPLFYHYAEDNNFCHRVLFHGLKIGIVKDSLIYHDREYRNDSYSPKKDFERETVKNISNPNKQRSMVADFTIALAKIIEISTKIRFYKIPPFMRWAFKEFFVLRKKVKSFDDRALYNFESDLTPKHFQK